MLIRKESALAAAMLLFAGFQNADGKLIVSGIVTPTGFNSLGGDVTGTYDFTLQDGFRLFGNFGPPIDNLTGNASECFFAPCTLAPSLFATVNVPADGGIIYGYPIIELLFGGPPIAIDFSSRRNSIMAVPFTLDYGMLYEPFSTNPNGPGGKPIPCVLPNPDTPFCSDVLTGAGLAIVEAVYYPAPVVGGLEFYFLEPRSFVFNPVPEPGTLMLVTGALASALLARRTWNRPFPLVPESGSENDKLVYSQVATANTQPRSLADLL